MSTAAAGNTAQSKLYDEESKEKPLVEDEPKPRADPTRALNESQDSSQIITTPAGQLKRQETMLESDAVVVDYSQIGSASLRQNLKKNSSSSSSKQRLSHSGQNSAGSNAAVKKASVSQASRSRDKPNQLGLLNLNQKNASKALILKSDMVSSSSVVPQTGSNLGSSIPTNGKKPQQALGAAQGAAAKKATRRRDTANIADSVSTTSNATASMKMRHKSAAVSHCNGFSNQNTSQGRGTVGASEKNSGSVAVEPENMSISNLRQQSGSQKSQKINAAQHHSHHQNPAKQSRKKGSVTSMRQRSARSKHDQQSGTSEKSQKAPSIKSVKISKLAAQNSEGDKRQVADSKLASQGFTAENSLERQGVLAAGADGGEGDEAVDQNELVPQGANQSTVGIPNEQLDLSTGLRPCPLPNRPEKEEKNEGAEEQKEEQLQQSRSQSEKLLNQRAYEDEANPEQLSLYTPDLLHNADSEIQSPGLATSEKQLESGRSDSGPEKILDLLPAPNPLLPKTLKVQDKPPESNIKGIVFRKLKEFKSFPEQPAEQLTDYVRQLKHEKTKSETSPLKEKSAGIGPVQISIEQSRLIRNIVFLRDVTILETLGKGIDELTQKDVFQHENFLDVKQLVRERDICERMTDQLENAIQRAKRQQQTKNLANINAVQAPGGTLDLRTGCYKLAGPEDRTLQFESRFESGNLYLATKVSEQEYDLLMQNDTNTLGHTQWFYFKVSNTRAGVPVKFNILNYSKPDSMFNYGMKVSVYSDQKAEAGVAGWHRACTDISYFKNQVRKDFNFVRYYHTLTFTYEFEYDHDTVFFAYCFPYTYTDLENDIMSIERDKRRQQYVTRTTLCKTLGGVNCEVLTITEQQQALKQPASAFGSAIKPKLGKSQKQGVVISARVHPGETVGSWMMRGVLFFLTDPDNKEAMLLRKNFIFKIIPMLNPDGVINGNYRCSLAGCDLNRRWKFPSKQLQPTVYHTKRLIKKVHTERTCVLYCDLHGHSRKPNIFMYGCDKKGAPEETRIFPLLLSKLSPLFDFASSRFGVQKSKEATARVAVFKELKTCPLVYTMESTFSGLDKGPHSGLHISTAMLESMGRDLCRALLIQCNLDVPLELQSMPTKGKKPSKTFSAEPPSDGEALVINQHALQIKETLIAELQSNKELLRAGNGDSSSGSDSEPSEDNLEATELVKNLPAVDKPLSLALKQEQAARRELAKQRRQERTSSPMKNQEPRWRFTSQSTMKNYMGENVESHSEARVRKRQTIKLSEIKEVNHEEVSNQSPLKVARDTAKQPAAKNTKVKMVDAITQTDRSDYMLLKARNQNKMMKSSGQRENTVQLRIANIELHETAFTNGSRSGFQNQTHHQHTHETTVNIHGPSVSDFNAIFTNGQVQVQASVKHNPSYSNATEATHRQKHRSQLYPRQDTQNISVHYQKYRPPMIAKTATLNKPFAQYIARQRDKMPTTPSKDQQQSASSTRNGSSNMVIGGEHANKALPAQDNVANSNNEMTPSQRTDRSASQVQARYGSVQQPRVQHIQDFQALSRAAAAVHLTQSKSLQNGSNNSNTREDKDQVAAGATLYDAPNNGTLLSQKDSDLINQDLISRVVQTGANPSRQLINTSDYPASNVTKAKRLQIGSGGGPGIHTNGQINKLSASCGRKTSQQPNDFSDQMQMPGNMGNQNVGQMILLEAQSKQRSSVFGQSSAIRASSDPFQPKQNIQRGVSDRKSTYNPNQSPLIAFLENQIQFEKSQFEKTHLQQNQKANGTGVNQQLSKGLNNEHSMYNDTRLTGAANGVNSSFSRTGGIPTSQYANQDFQKMAYMQERGSESRPSNQQLIQLRPLVSQTSDGKKQQHVHDNNYLSHQISPVQLQQAHMELQQWQSELNPTSTMKQVNVATNIEPYKDNSFASSTVDFQTRHSGSNTSKKLGSGGNGNRKLVQQNQEEYRINKSGLSYIVQPNGTTSKSIPAGVRNQVQQQNISSLYSQVYQQQSQSHSISKNTAPTIRLMQNEVRVQSPDVDTSLDPGRTHLGSHPTPNQISLFAKNKAQSVKSSGNYSTAKQSVQYVDQNINSLQTSSAKFMMQPPGTTNHSSNKGTKYSIVTNTEAQSPTNNDRMTIQQMQERRNNISDMQIYRNKTMQSALSNHENVGAQLPTLQKFGSQNEILSNSRQNQRQSTSYNNHSHQKNQSQQGANFTKIQHSAQNWIRSQQPNNSGQYQINTTGDFEYSVPFMVAKEQQKGTTASVPSQGMNHQVTELGRAHADGRPINEMRTSSNLQKLSPGQQQRSQMLQKSADVKPNKFEANVRFGDNSNVSSGNQTQLSTVPAHQKNDSDYFMIMRQHNQAFVPMGKTISKKKVSSSSQGPSGISSTVLSAAQVNRSQNGAMILSQGGNQNGPTAMYPQITQQQQSQSPPGSQYLQKTSKLDVTADVKAASFKAAPSVPVDFNVLQSRQLVNANPAAQTSCISAGAGPSLGQRKTSQTNSRTGGVRAAADSPTPALPSVQPNNALAALNGTRTEAGKKASNSLQQSYISSKK